MGDRRSIGVPHSPVKIGLPSRSRRTPVVDTVRAAVLRFFRVRLGSTDAPEQQGLMPTVIAGANQEGGVCKTTTTANHGAALARHGRRVLLIDMEPQGNLTSAVGISKKAEHTIAEAL